MPVTVYRRLKTANRLVNDASALAGACESPTWLFEVASDAVANGDLNEPDYLLQCIEDKIGQEDILTPVRNARQLIVALQEEAVA